MSKDIRKWTTGRYTLMFDEHTFFVWDNEKDERMCALEVTEKLNELSYENDILNKNEDDLEECTIENIKLREENAWLRQMIKGNVFERYREGSLADLKFKAIAYDDIVKVEMSYELEPRVIVYCKQGKKENIMSFCQMFIPFGVAYEIKEVIDDE